jgi:hypothetical protein
MNQFQYRLMQVPAAGRDPGKSDAGVEVPLVKRDLLVLKLVHVIIRVLAHQFHRAWKNVLDVSTTGFWTDC